MLKLGMAQTDVVKHLGRPITIATSAGGLVPYYVSPPKGEKVMLYTEYPWGDPCISTEFQVMW